MTDAVDLYVFIHVPKTGGTTLRTHFQTHLKDQQDFVHFADKGDAEARAAGLTPFAERSAAEQLRTRVLLGHNLTREFVEALPHRRKHTVLVYRDPVAWDISRYNQAMHEWRGRGQDAVAFLTWCNEHERIHSQFDWFDFRYVQNRVYRPRPQAERLAAIQQALLRVDAVVPLQRLQPALVPIFDALRVPHALQAKNVTQVRNKNHYREDAESRAWLEKQANLDRPLIDWIKNKFF